MKKIIPTLDVFHTAHKTKISGSKDKISYTKNKNSFKAIRVVNFELNTKVMMVEMKKLSVEEYLNKITSYLKSVINDLKK